MDMGELRFSLLGGEDDGLMLSEELRRERRLMALSLSSTRSFGKLIQEAFTGMLCCRISWAEPFAAKRGGGGRGGGDRLALSTVLGF